MRCWSRVAGGIQTATDDAGRDSAIIRDLLLTFTIVTAIFFVAVMAFLIAAYWRRGGKRQDGIPDEEGVSHERGLRLGFYFWVGAVGGALTVLTFASYLTDRGLAQANPDNKPVLSIQLTGNQWWWDVQYHYQDPSKNIRTANEIHLPVGMPAMIYLQSNDVIHSFWVPNLAGKQDLIPGRVNDIVLMPRRIGHYRAQCAEYCGLQHAHMALDVFVELARRLRQVGSGSGAAGATADHAARQGRLHLFHDPRVQHLPQYHRHARLRHRRARPHPSRQPHDARRRHVADEPGQPHAWIADPQGVKPGNNMPYVGLNADELQAVEAYLETLK